MRAASCRAVPISNTQELYDKLRDEAATLAATYLELVQQTAALRQQVCLQQGLLWWQSLHC